MTYWVQLVKHGIFEDRFSFDETISVYMLMIDIALIAGWTEIDNIQLLQVVGQVSWGYCRFS